MLMLDYTGVIVGGDVEIRFRVFDSEGVSLSYRYRYRFDRYVYGVGAGVKIYGRLTGEHRFNASSFDSVFYLIPTIGLTVIPGILLSNNTKIESNLHSSLSYGITPK